MINGFVLLLYQITKKRETNCHSVKGAAHDYELCESAALLICMALYSDSPLLIV